MRITRSIKRFVVPVWLGTLACVAALGLANCTMVSDSLTGVNLQRSQTSACLGDCRSDYHEALAAERKRHQIQDEICRSLPDPDRTACLQAEDALYQQNTALLKSAYQDCQNNCHRQGAGTAG